VNSKNNIRKIRIFNLQFAAALIKWKVDEQWHMEQLPVVGEAIKTSRNPQTAADLAMIDASIRITFRSTSQFPQLSITSRWRHITDSISGSEARLWQRRCEAASLHAAAASTYGSAPLRAQQIYCRIWGQNGAEFDRFGACATKTNPSTFLIRHIFEPQFKCI